MDIVLSALKMALKKDKPVIIMYESKGDISQRRIFVRKLSEDSVFAYCTKKKSLRVFKLKNILSAVIAEEE